MLIGPEQQLSRAQSLLSAYDEMADHVRVASSRLGLRASVVKSLAGAALMIHHQTGEPLLDLPPRLSAALARREGGTPTAMRKASSEARAILLYGLREAPDFAALPAERRGEAIALAVVRVRKREAALIRAEALCGTRGGRPSREDRGATWRAVMKLIRRADAGDTAAGLELQHIRVALLPYEEQRAFTLHEQGLSPTRQ